MSSIAFDRGRAYGDRDQGRGQRGGDRQRLRAHAVPLRRDHHAGLALVHAGAHASRTRCGRRATGYAADFLAFRWFDKRPEKSLADNCADLIRTVEVARELYLEAGRDGPRTPFRLFLDSYPEIERQALAEGFNRLGASFGSSMLERAVIDAVGRLAGRSLFELVRGEDLGIELGAISPELAGRQLAEFLPARPLQRLHVRHTVGLLDPISAADVAEPVNDGLPETLEDYLDRDGIGYLKVKVAGALADDLARLEAIAAVLARRERARSGSRSTATSSTSRSPTSSR